MLGHAEAKRRRHQGPCRRADALRDQLGAERVGADQAVRSMLLGRADRQKDAPTVLQITLDLLPGAACQQHRTRPRLCSAPAG
jgi:hypothetical protein